MKIILSRKGFDSSSGGYPSPILPDGTLLSIPISSNGDKIAYSDLHYKDKSYYEIMMEIKTKGDFKSGDRWHDLKIDTECHLDPDLNAEVYKRNDDWLAAFGQIGSSQTHLENQLIEKDDLFLFFGWFRETIIEKNRYQFKGGTSGFHAIFGYLQIGEIIRNDNYIPNWLKYHSHCLPGRANSPSNCLYIAREGASWNKSIPGAGTFKFDKSLRLTKEGYSRSCWQLPDLFRNVKISYHSNNSWKKEGYFKSVNRGQEFVIEENGLVEKWARQLIENNIYKK